MWRRNTRGDYWVIDLGTRKLRKLGGDAVPSHVSVKRIRQAALRYWNHIKA